MKRLIYMASLAAVTLMIPVGAQSQDATAKVTPPADYQRVIELLNGNQTNIGQPLTYPAGALKITSLVVTMQPGEETGRHMHPVPTYGYILEGEVTITYEGAKTKHYKAGEAFMEAVHTWHNGRATGDVPTRILAIFMGVDDTPNVIRP